MHSKFTWGWLEDRRLAGGIYGGHAWCGFAAAAITGALLLEGLNALLYEVLKAALAIWK